MIINDPLLIILVADNTDQKGETVGSNRIFWSGGLDVAAPAAQGIAKEIGATTIEQTIYGSALSRVTNVIGY